MQWAVSTTCHVMLKPGLRLPERVMSDAWTSELDELASPLSAESPCGVSLEYDPEFLALEEAASGTPEIEYGDTLTQATAADWTRVMQMALPLARRSRDLRLAVYLARAALNQQGITGLTAGLGLIERLLDEQWEHLHPQLDPDDDNDPQLRVNILAGLGEPAGLLQELREAALVEVPAMGRVSLRDIDLASGELTSTGDQEKPSLAMIDAVFQAAGHAPLANVITTLDLASDRARRIETILTEQVGFGRAIDLSPLSALLRRAADQVRQRLPQPAVASDPAVPEGSVASAVTRTEIASREDVRQTLDRLCAYFTVHEPTSPVPLLLQRARKLLDLNFMELLQDLAPDGVAQMALVSGIRNDDRSDD
jgi:type VI secretion system protein ImpA